MLEAMLPEALTLEQRAGVVSLVEALAALPGVQAVVLGGSFARGTQRPGSDVDLGIYYRAGEPFDIEAVRRVAAGVAVKPPTVTGFYVWGAWVNGGAWIQTAWGKVDFLYRNLDQVEQTIDEAELGIVQHDYAQQPAYGFYSVIYLAETAVCIPLYDPSGVIARLKQRVALYPPQLKEAVANSSLWSAEFTLLHARSFAASSDVYNTVGCLTRAGASLTQALFALNERYFMSDKRVAESIDGFALRPPAFTGELAGILGRAGDDAATLTQSVAQMEALWRAVVELTGGRYRPQFVL